MTSKFDSIMKSARGEGESLVEDSSPPVVRQKPRKLRKVEDPTPGAQRGRPKAKHSDPDFQQVTAYVRKETYKATKIALLQQEPEQEFSELVEDLLANWLRRK